MTISMSKRFILLIAFMLGGSGLYGLYAQVLTRDSLALVGFYNDTFGDTWINNTGWLESSVGQWYGVGLDPGGQVISLKLPANGLKGNIGPAIEGLVSLHVLDVSDNQLTGLPEVFNQMEVSAVDVGKNQLSTLPDYSAINRTFSLFVNDNLLDFSDLEPNSGLPGLFYTPQQDLVTSEVMLSDLNQYALLEAQIPGQFNHYQWYLDGLPMSNTDAQLEISTLTFDDLGLYECKVTNDLLPGLEITGASIEVRVPTILNGFLMNRQNQGVAAMLQVYRLVGEEYVLTNTLSVSNGNFDLEIGMGQYLIKAVPTNTNLLPIYLNSASAYWQEADDLRIDGTHGFIEVAFMDETTAAGNSTIRGPLPESLNVQDILLFQISNDQRELIAHINTDSDSFSFLGLAEGTYQIVFDLPGVVGLESEYIELGPTATAEITLDLPQDEVSANHSIARKWNEALLAAIRRDFARPTVHARNLFHLSAAFYDIWATMNPPAQTFLLGNRRENFSSFFDQFPLNGNSEELMEEAISYAAFRLLNHRFANSPNAVSSAQEFLTLFTSLGYDPDYTSTDFSQGDAAALGNFVAQSYIEYGLQDGSNEQNDYANLHYVNKNPPLVPAFPGNPNIVSLNHWQPLSLGVFIDQAGNVIPRDTPDFLSPEWGQVSPFALQQTDATDYPVDDFVYRVYHNPPAPPLLDSEEERALYQWGFSLVSIWSSHLDPSDGVLWDISPASKGNNPPFPTEFSEYDQFYDLYEGGDPGQGYDINPVTQQPYQPHVVPRGDYTRVIAEFWADGPDSETPPGHWFTLLNYVNDHPLVEKRYEGQGDPVDNLEWDIKSYFTLGGAMHDAAITAWGIKGYYDYIRPVSAIRGMADLGQSSNISRFNYDINGLPLHDGFIELVFEADPIALADPTALAKLKVKAWRGPDYIINPENFAADVDWILAENWWPYQRPTFVTPPFAGYISGHSTFSRAAAEVLTLLTGSPYFPGGLGTFTAKKDEFLVFEEGPSVDVTLQWATYRDASDETSLSRIWGGIHPPADDIPGRIIGEQVGIDAFNYAKAYFEGRAPIQSPAAAGDLFLAYPVPADDLLTIRMAEPGQNLRIDLIDLNGKIVFHTEQGLPSFERISKISTADLAPGMYILQIHTDLARGHQKITIR